MNRFESKKVVWFPLVLITAILLVTWLFFSGNNGISATSEKEQKKDLKEKEIEVKVLDENKKDTESSEDDTVVIKRRMDIPKDLEQYLKDFEKTQRQMEKMMERMQKEHEQMMRDFFGGGVDVDPFGRDDWDITPRFRSFPRGGFFRFMPRDFGFDIWSEDFGRDMGFSTAMDVQEDKDKIVIKCDIPGMEKDKIEVTLKERQLTIKGSRETSKEKRKDEKGGRIILSERSSGVFSRTITLPKNADTENIKSKYENGVLEIIVPKIPEKEPEEKKIIINTE